MVQGLAHWMAYRDEMTNIQLIEADAVLILDSNEYCLIEFKLGSSGIEEGAKHLLKLKDIILSNNLKPPTFEMIITGTEMAYTRKDGIKVVPIGCLGV